MNYEEKYKSALGWMQSLYGGLHGATKEEAEKYFPELKESEDERIRKALIEYFGEQCDMSDWNGVYGYQVLAWLEKQGKQNFDYEHADIPQKDFAPIEQKTLNAEKQDHMLDSNKVIVWLNDQACQGWIEDVQVDKFIAKFKKDFGL